MAYCKKKKQGEYLLYSPFNRIISSLGITKNKYIPEKNMTSSGPIDKAIMKFQVHSK